MAIVRKCTCITCVFLLVLFVSHQLHSAEARHLKSNKKHHHHHESRKSLVISSNADSAAPTATSEHTLVAAAIGGAVLSPKVGLTGGYYKATVNQPKNVKGANTVAQVLDCTIAAPSLGASHDVQDFRPTAPGHSPGVGHSIQH